MSDPAAWNPDQYLRFAAPRLRPAMDLLARIPLAAADTVYDLGCGTGIVAPALAARFPSARLVGVDSSPEMLDRARATDTAAEWVLADLTDWMPEAPADLFYSNAVFQWLGDHPVLFPRLLTGLRRGGVLAVQMPHNHAAPSLAGIAEAAHAGPWSEVLDPLLRPAPVAEPQAYHDILTPHVSALDIWETDYLQVLEGPDAVVEWTRGTSLKPLLDALADRPDWHDAFLDAYRRRMAESYPRRADGTTLLPFRRLFFVAVR
ncbi:MAG: methyltransferase domain-containing protein [Rhodobacterales bacterium]|nr:methyltransferase domain-containing protein [Rhodobacterales bacterium]